MAKKKQEPKKEIVANSLGLSIEKQKEVAKWVYEEVNRAWEESKSRRDKYSEWDMYYDGDLPEKSVPWENCANINCGLVADGTDQVHEKILAAFIMAKPRIIVKGIGKDDTKDDKDKELYLDYEHTKKIHLDDVMDDALDCIARYGKCIVQTSYKREKRRVTRWVEGDKTKKEVDEFPQGKTASVNKIVYEGVYFDPITKPEDFISPSDCPSDIQKSRWLGRYKWYSPEEMKEFKAKKKFINILDVKPQSDDKTDREKQANELVGIHPDEKKRHKTIDFWCKYDYNDDGIRETCRFIIGLDKENGIFLDGSLNPYFHNEYNFNNLRIKKRLNGPEGYSMIELVLHHHKEINSMHNQALDNWTICINKVFKSLKGTIDLSKNSVKPGANLEVENMNEFEVLELGDVNLSTQAMIGMVKQYADIRLGLAGAYGSGMESQRDPRAPAKKALTLLGQAGIRLDLYLKRLNRDIGKLIEQEVALLYQYLPEEHEFMVLDRDGDQAMEEIEVTEDGNKRTEKRPLFGKISRKQLLSKCDYFLGANTVEMNKELEKQSALFMFELMMKNPLLSTPPTTLMQMGVEQLEAMYNQAYEVLKVHGEKDIESKLPNVKDILESGKMLMLAQQQMQSQQQQGQAQQEQQMANADTQRQAQLQAQKAELDAKNKPAGGKK